MFLIFKSKILTFLIAFYDLKISTSRISFIQSYNKYVETTTRVQFIQNPKYEKVQGC